MSAGPAGRTRLYDGAELETILDAMAAEVAALAPPSRNLVLIGILRRGAPLADRLAERLVGRHGMSRPLRLDLAVKRYADDLTLLYPDTQLEENAQLAKLDLSGQSVLLVDDVLYSGHSLLKVLNYLARWRPAEVRVAMLVDRCVARLPVHADVTGLRLQMAAGAVLECHVPPYESEFLVELVQGGVQP